MSETSFSDSFVQPQEKRSSTLEKKLASTPFIDSPTYEIISWKNKWKSSKYFFTGTLIWYLNVVNGVSLTAILLTIFYIKGVMTIIKCKLKGPTFTEEKRKADKEEDILTEESV